MCHVQGIDDLEPDMTVDAAARVPARVGLQRIVDAHGDDVDARDEMLGDVVREADVTVRPLAEMNTVDPDVAVHVDAVELEPGLAARRSLRQAKRLAIPADARREV